MLTTTETTDTAPPSLSREQALTKAIHYAHQAATIAKTNPASASVANLATLSEAYTKLAETLRRTH